MPDARYAETLRALVVIGSSLACVGTAHQLVNQRLLRRPPADPPAVSAAVSVLVPARDEAHRIAPTIRSLLAQQGLPDAEILVLDDGSTDGTADVVRAVAGVGSSAARADRQSAAAGVPRQAARVRAAGAAARGEILVFVDADVVLAPHAVAAAVALLRGPRPLDLLSPWPRQVVAGWSGRLIQPLLAWSWLTTLPLRVAERSRRPSMAAANGQFLVVDAAALARAGGWRAGRRVRCSTISGWPARSVRPAAGRGSPTGRR